MFDVDASDVRWSLLLLPLLLLLSLLFPQRPTKTFVQGERAGLGRQGGLGTPPIYPQDICK